MQRYEVYFGYNAYKLVRDGVVVRERTGVMRQFKRVWWRTRQGAQKAADKLNAAITASLATLEDAMKKSVLLSIDIEKLMDANPELRAEVVMRGAEAVMRKHANNVRAAKVVPTELQTERIEKLMARFAELPRW